MIQKIKGYLSQKNVLYESLNVLVTKENGEYVFKFKGKRGTRESYTDIQVGDEKYRLEDELRFSEDITNKSNITVKRHGDVKFEIGDNYSDTTFRLYITQDQLENMNDLVLNQQNVLEKELELSVSKLDDIWCLSINGLRENVNYKINADFASGYPDLRIDGMKSNSDQELDLTTVTNPYINCQLPINFTGEILINKRKRDIKEINSVNKPLKEFSHSSLFGDINELDQKIQEWNNQSVTVTVKPDDYTPVQKTENTSDSPNNITNITFEKSSFVECGTIMVEYEKDINVFPWISYAETDYDTDIIDENIRCSRSEGNKYIFDKTVVPSEKIKIFHSRSSYYWFEDSCVKTSIQSGETKTLTINPELRRVGLSLTNDLDEPVTVSLNDNSAYVEDSVEIESEVGGENTIEIKNTKGDILLSETVTVETLIQYNSSNISQLINSG